MLYPAPMNEKSYAYPYHKIARIAPSEAITPLLRDDQIWFTVFSVRQICFNFFCKLIKQPI